MVKTQFLTFWSIDMLSLYSWASFELLLFYLSFFSYINLFIIFNCYLDNWMDIFTTITIDKYTRIMPNTLNWKRERERKKAQKLQLTRENGNIEYANKIFTIQYPSYLCVFEQ